MRNLIFAAAAAAALLSAPASAADAPKADSCIECHRKAKLPLDREHDYSEWEKSVHAKAGVSCHSCHGGDPTVSGAEAHKGVLSSADPKSQIYFTKVPETCGSCHGDELAAFRKSAHSKELQRTGKGPNCVTCHGSMANEVMSPQQMENACSLCHRKPTGARPALLALNNASAAVDRLGALAASTGNPDAKARHEALSHARADMRSDWHAFDLKKALQKAQGLTKEAITAIHAFSGKKR